MTALEQVVADSKRLAARTKAQYRAVVRSFVAFAGSTWTPATVDAWLQQLTVSPRSLNAYLAGLKYASRRWAALYDGRDFAAAAETVLVPVEKQPTSPTPLSDPELDVLLKSCRRADDPTDLRDRALLAVALNAGFRRFELASIEFGDLDVTEKSIVVIAKRNKRHRVRLSTSCWARLEAWTEWLRRRHIGSGRIFRSLRRCLDAELGWCVGASMTGKSVYEVVRRRAKRAGIDRRVVTHSLRHSLVRVLRDRGVPESEIAKRVGHASVETTAGYGGDVIVDGGDDGLPS